MEGVIALEAVAGIMTKNISFKLKFEIKKNSSFMHRMNLDCSDSDGGGGGYQAKSFHDSMGNAGEKRDRSRSPPNNSGSGWGGSRDRSRSPERFNSGPPARSFHELMMERAAARNSQQ